MTSQLIQAPAKQVNDALGRFDARYFTLNFRTGSVATVVANTATALEVNAQFRSNLDLVGLFWNSEDTYGHSLLKYATNKDYTGCIWAFVANPYDPYNFSLTIKVNSKTYIYRLFPYVVSGSDIVPNVTDPTTQGPGPNLTYTITSVFPGGLSVPAGYQIYVVDFSHLQLGYDFNEGKIPSNPIDSVFTSLVTSAYGIGSTATLDNATGGTLTTWNISNVPVGFRLQAGDTITVTYSISSTFYTEDVLVTTFTQPTSTTLSLTMDVPRSGVTWIGGKVSAKVLTLDSAIGDVALNFQMQNMSVTGSGTTVGKYTYPQAANGLQMATGYDDTYNITPWRQAKQIYDLGYRNDVVCYMGASHYYQSNSTLVSNIYYNQLTIGASTPLNTPTVAWCTSFFAELHTLGLGFIWSTSLEMLLSAIPDTWAQKDYLFGLARSGYTPPTSFLSPASSDAQTYLISVITQGLSLMQSAGLTLKFQLGEFWWWDGTYQNLQTCIYDVNALNLYHSQTGNYAPQDPISPAINTSFIYNSNQSLTAAQTTYANWLGGQLGAFTKAVKDGVKSTYSSSLACLLFFSPQIFAVGSTLLPIINFPSNAWKYSTGDYDFMQIEDYDWIINGQLGRLPLTLQAATGTGTLPNGASELGYPLSLVHYFIGFVPVGNVAIPLGAKPGTTENLDVWDYCSIALNQAITNGLSHIYLWAYPQAVRDNIVVSNVTYVEPIFPVGQSWYTLIRPEFKTMLETSEGDWETRVNSWGGLVRYEFVLQQREILPALTGTVIGDFNNLVSFFMNVSQNQNQVFRTRKGTFRINVQTDNSVTGQQIGIGDGSTISFQLLKTYTYDIYTYTRLITKPNAQPLIYLNGVLQTSGWYCDLFSGVVSFATPPENAVVITATFTFDFPARFTSGQLPISVDMDYGIHGLDELTILEDMQTTNLLSASYGSSVESNFPPDLVFFPVGTPKVKGGYQVTEGGNEITLSSYGSELLYEFTLQPRDIFPAVTNTLVDEFNNTINFFLCVAQGRNTAFRFNYEYDNSVTGQQIGIGDGTTTVFQLIKTYTFGSFTYTKKITKLVVGTVVPHWSSGSFTFTVDHTTGLVTFNTAPALNVVITCDFQFDYLVRLDSNKLTTSLDQDYGTYGIDEVKLIEVRA